MTTKHQDPAGTPSRVAAVRARPAPGRRPAQHAQAAQKGPQAAEIARELSVVQQQPLALRIPAAAASLAPRAYVAESQGEVYEAEPLKTGFFEMVNLVKAVTVYDKNVVVVDSKKTLAAARGYEKDDLFAIAEIAYHYLMNGGAKVAHTLFEGLVAVLPSEPYFLLGLGLAADHLGEREAAFSAYTRASELDPGDPRPDVNRAELLVEERNVARALQFLQHGLTKARNRGDAALERKASAMLKHLSRAA